MSKEKLVIVRGREDSIQDLKAAPKCEANVITYGNIWTRQIKMNEGQIKAGHKHQFDHLHFLASGSVVINVYDTKDRDKVIYSGEYVAPAWIKVPKEHFHDIRALEDGTTGYCIQALHNEDGNVVDTDYSNDKDWIELVNEYEKNNGMQDEELK